MKDKEFWGHTHWEWALVGILGKQYHLISRHPKRRDAVIEYAKVMLTGEKAFYQQIIIRRVEKK